MRRTASEVIRNLERRVARLENKTARVNTTYTIIHKLMDDSGRKVLGIWKDTGRLTGTDFEDAISREFGKIDDLHDLEVGSSSITIEEVRGHRGYNWGVEDHFTEELLDEAGYLETTLIFKGLRPRDLDHIAHLLEGEEDEFIEPGW